MSKIALVLRVRLQDVISTINDLKGVLAYSTKILKKHRMAFAGILPLKCVVFLLGLSIIYITKVTIDSGILAKNTAVFLKFSVLGILAYFFMYLSGFLVDILIKKLRMKFSFEVKYDLTGRLFGSPYLVIKKASSSESAFFVDYDYANIENIVFEQV
ncbi:MAG: hypothetical protein PHW46_06585, partial [Candidatus Omnitrophica bacterium]|nr:hypothetical protein [Candidatus Omnitrophota bacterium]